MHCLFPAPRLLDPAASYQMAYNCSSSLWGVEPLKALRCELLALSVCFSPLKSFSISLWFKFPWACSHSSSGSITRLFKRATVCCVAYDAALTASARLQYRYLRQFLVCELLRPVSVSESRHFRPIPQNAARVIRSSAVVKADVIEARKRQLGCRKRVVVLYPFP